MSSCTGTKGDGHVLWRYIKGKKKKKGDKPSLVSCIFFMHYLSISSTEAVRKKGKSQAVLPCSKFGFGGPTLPTGTPISEAHRMKEHISKQTGLRWTKLSGKMGEKNRTTWNVVSLCLLCFAYTTGRALHLSVPLQLMRSAQPEWNTLRLTKITLWTH